MQAYAGLLYAGLLYAGLFYAGLSPPVLIKGVPQTIGGNLRGGKAQPRSQGLGEGGSLVFSTT